jgi:hypothetical protein
MESEARQRTEHGDGASDVPRGAIAPDEKEHRAAPARTRAAPWPTGTKKRERERRGEGDGLLARRRRRLRTKDGRWSPSQSGMCRTVTSPRAPSRLAPSTARATGSA